LQKKAVDKSRWGGEACKLKLERKTGPEQKGKKEPAWFIIGQIKTTIDDKTRGSLVPF